MRSQWFRVVMPVLALFPAAAFSQTTLPPQFTLGRYVPADSWMYIHGVDNPECHWVEQRWADVFQGLVDSGVAEDVKNLVLSLIPAEHRTATRAGLDRMVELIAAVKWRDLANREFVFAERVSSSGLGYDYLWLVRGNRETSEYNFKALLAIVREITGFSDSIAMEESQRGSVRLLAVGARGKDNKLEPSVWVWRNDDVIGVVFAPPMPHRDRSLIDDVLALTSGDTKVRSMVDAPRFHEALAHVQRPADVVSFFDIKTFVGDLRNMFKKIDERVGQGENGEHAGVRAVSRLIDLADFVDYSITTETTKGDRLLTDAYTRYQQGKRDEALARMRLDRQPFEHFDRFIPRNATSFSLSSGIDIEVLYDFAIGFVRDNVPGGDQVIAALDSGYEQLGFDPQRDLFSWWSGETIQVAMPATVVTPMGGGSDWALMIRVKDPKVASARVNEVIDWASKTLQQRGQMLMVSPANCKCGGGFREVTHPMLAMIARPVIGVHGDWLIIAKSADTVNRCAAVAAGDAPSILQNERFRKEGLIPDGPIHGLSFEDLSHRGKAWSGAAAAIGMMGGMAIGMLPPEIPKEARQLIQSALGIVTKLAPLLQRINFYSSKATRRVKEGDLAFRSQAVVTYQRPSSDGSAVSDAKP